MMESKSNVSRGVLVWLIVVLVVMTALLAINTEFLTNVYLRNQLTATGYIINGGILALFLLGLGRMVVLLLRYMREERALYRFARALAMDSPLASIDLDQNTLIARRYQEILTLSEHNAPINHAALASVQVARESTAISLPKFVNNILILTGVFGTIVSLSIALVGASDVLGSAQQGPGSMGMIIHGMSTALSTTITAIVCYLVYGYFYLRLTDVQTHLLSQVEQITTFYLMPRYAYTPDNLMQRIAGLVKALSGVAEVMRTVQADNMAASTQLHSLIASLNQRTKPMSDDLKSIKRVLHEGFRLPETELAETVELTELS